MAIKGVTVVAIHILMPLLTHGTKSMEGKYFNRQIVQTLYDSKFLQQRYLPKVCLVIKENFSEHNIVDFKKLLYARQFS